VHFDFGGAGGNMSTRDRHTIHTGLAVQKQTVVPAAEPVPEVEAAVVAAVAQTRTLVEQDDQA
jgi:hypothetical protein